MTEGSPTPGNEAAGAYFAQLRQGHVVMCAPGTDDWSSLFPSGTEAAVVVSQTCDVVLAKRESVVLGPVVTLAGDDAKAARRRDNPRYVHLPLVGDDHFVDLGHLHAVGKDVLSGLACAPGIPLQNDDEVRTFALAVGRWFSRFAFPDEVTPWLRPLYAIVREKYDRPESPLGKVLHDVIELRLEAEKWSERPLALTLHVIVRAGAMPTLEDGAIELSRRRAPALRPDGTLKTPGDLAPLLLAADAPSVAAALWGAFAEAMAELCRPKGRDSGNPAVAGAVSEVTALLWSDDEFPLSRLRKSELLDLDYLSGGFPL